jgi:regulation of enolase protein 1 (concanavalin A-like superfamily)
MPIVQPRLIVELYEGWGFTGKRAVVVDSVPDLSALGMYDRVFSLRVFKGPGYPSSPDQKLVLFDQPHFQGNRLALGPGFYPNLQDVVRRFGSVRSLKMEAALDTGGPEWGGIPLIIELYSLPNFGGRKTTVIRDIPSIKEIGQENVISSIRIYKGPNFPRRGCRAVFYSEEDFSGLVLPMEMRPADYVKDLSDLRLLPSSFNNLISSIKIEGWAASSEFDTVVFQDEFHGTTFDKGWHWIDPNGGGEWRAHQGFLQMTVQPGQDLWHGANFDAPRILRETRGDFAVETRLRIESTLKEHGGLLVWKNEHRFLRLEKTCAAHAFRGDVRFERHQWQASSLIGRGTELQKPKRLYLRMERNGDVFSGYASEDGVTWQHCGSTVMGMADPVMVGLHALAPGNIPATLTQFDYFRLSHRKRDVMRDKKATTEISRARQMLAFRRSLDQIHR